MLFTIGLQNSRLFFIESEVTLKPIVTHSFSRASCLLHIFTSSFDWFVGLSACALCDLLEWQL